MGYINTVVDTGDITVTGKVRVIVSTEDKNVHVVVQLGTDKAILWDAVIPSPYPPPQPMLSNSELLRRIANDIDDADDDD